MSDLTQMTEISEITENSKQELPVVEIRVSKKFDSPKFGADVQLRDICHQVAKLLYNGTYANSVNGILGSRQQLRFAKNRLRESKFIVVLPDLDLTPPKHTGSTCSGTYVTEYSRGIQQMQRDLKAMINHASREGVMISLG